MVRRIKNIAKFGIKKFHSLGNSYVRVFDDEKSFKLDFLVGPFFSKYFALRFAEKYLEKYIEVPLNCIVSDKKNIYNNNLLPKFNEDRINSINFNHDLLNLHKKNFLLGKVLNYIHKDSIVVDVGANKGLYSAAFAEKAKIVYAFEVSDPVLVQLMQTASKFKNIKIIKKAVNDKTNNSSFFIDENRFSNSGLVKQVKGPVKQVKCIKLDDYFLKKNIRIDFVKIDTEGTEINVLRGMSNLIDKFRPHIMVECWGKQSAYNHAEMYSFFGNRNYYCYINLQACGMVNLKDKETFIKVSNSSRLVKITDGDFFFSPKPLW